MALSKLANSMALVKRFYHSVQANSTTFKINNLNYTTSHEEQKTTINNVLMMCRLFEFHAVSDNNALTQQKCHLQSNYWHASILIDDGIILNVNIHHRSWRYANTQQTEKTPVRRQMITNFSSECSEFVRIGNVLCTNSWLLFIVEKSRFRFILKFSQMRIPLQDNRSS